MHRDAQLEGLADARRFDALADAAPKSRVKQNHINRGIEDVSCELLKVNDYRIRGQRHLHFLAHPSHAIHAKDGILKVIVADVFDLLTEPDGRFCGPNTIRIETKAITVKLCCQRAVTIQFVFRWEDAAF